MGLNPLTPVTDYQSMLNRIFWFTSATALAAIWILRKNVPGIDWALEQVDFQLEFGGDRILPVPGSYLAPAMAIGLVSRVFRIHGHLDRWLGIRERFDVDVIIRGLALRVGVDLSGMPDEELVQRRHGIMRRGFYPFVSAGQPQIDPELVHRTLDIWSWFWIVLEAVFLFVVTSFVLISSGEQTTGLLLFATSLIAATVGLPAIRHECRRYALAEVRAIADDPTRSAQVREALLAILPADVGRPAAA